MKEKFELEYLFKTTPGVLENLISQFLYNRPSEGAAPSAGSAKSADKSQDKNLGKGVGVLK